MSRRGIVLALLITIICSIALADPHDSRTSFFLFLQELWPDARAGGISRSTFDIAFAGLAPDKRVITATTRQPEYIMPIGQYVNSISSMENIEVGKRKALEWADTLSLIEKTYSVPRSIILAIWGVETTYGENIEQWDVFQSLATLAQAQYRHPYFRNELLAALRIFQNDRISRNKMVGSWAGTMGQPQFMPSNFIDYAVDFSGDGLADIWTNVPDVLASIANYLQKEG